MVQSGQYMAHGSWLCGSYSTGLKHSCTEAYWRMLHDPTFCSANDVALVFFDQDKAGRYSTIAGTVGDDECDLVGETLDECKERAERLKTQFDAEEADPACLPPWKSKRSANRPLYPRQSHPSRPNE